MSRGSISTPSLKTLWSNSSTSPAAPNVVQKMADRRKTRQSSDEPEVGKQSSLSVGRQSSVTASASSVDMEDLIDAKFNNCFTDIVEMTEHRHRETCHILSALLRKVDGLDLRINDYIQSSKAMTEFTNSRSEANQSGPNLQVQYPSRVENNLNPEIEMPEFDSELPKFDGDMPDSISVEGETRDSDADGVQSGDMPFHRPKARRNSQLVMSELAQNKRERTSFTRSSRTSSGSLGLTMNLLKIRERPEWQKMVWQFLDDPDSVRCGRFCMNLVSMFILLGVVLPLLQLMTDYTFIDPLTSTILELCLNLVFALETFFRLYVSPNRIRFFFDFYNEIDIAAACLPLVLYICQLELLDESSTLDAIYSCWVPILRLLKLLRRFETFHLLTKALQEAREALPMLFFTLLLIVLVFATLIFSFEPRENVATMGDALWFTIVTIGTIGYGDIVPKTPAGLASSSALIVISALYMAIPLGIVGESFSQVWKDRDRLVLVHRARTRFLNIGYKAEDIPQMFCGWDSDGDGEIDLPEFLSMMKTMEIDMPASRLVQLFASFDGDGSGTIDDQEFVRRLFPEAYAELYASIELTGEEIS